MRLPTLSLLLSGLLLAGLVSAAEPELDADLMRNIDDSTKALDSSIALKDAKAAAEQARELASLFAQVEAHYAQAGAKEDAAEALRFTQASQALVSASLQAVQAKDFDRAAERLGDLTRSCKTCHNVYKKS